MSPWFGCVRERRPPMKAVGKHATPPNDRASWLPGQGREDRAHVVSMNEIGQLSGPGPRASRSTRE